MTGNLVLTIVSSRNALLKCLPGYYTGFLINLFLNFYLLIFGMWDFSSPNQGLNLCPLCWKFTVLTTGPQGKYPVQVSGSYCLDFYVQTQS